MSRREQRFSSGDSRNNRNREPRDFTDHQSSMVQNKQEYDDLIRRLKLLSKSQSAFLKIYLQSKLSAAASLVSRAIIKVRHLNKDDPSVGELEVALSSLKLEELEVDYNNTELLLREEVALLRNTVFPEGGSTGAPSNDKLASLDSENQNLRGLLAEAKAEILAKEKQIASLSSNSMAPPLPPATLSLGSSNQSAEFNELNSKLAQKESALNSKIQEIAQLTEQNKQLSKTAEGNAAGDQLELIKLREELFNTKKLIDKEKEDSSQKLLQREQELKKQAENALKDAEKKFETQKEELMEAMAQEVEAVEKKHEEEGSVLKSENKKLKKSLSKLSTANQTVSSGAQKLKTKILEMKIANKDLATETKKQVSALGASLRENFGKTIIAKSKEHDARMEELRRKYKKELLERKKLHNQLQELKGNIRVYMRCRPPSERELENHGNDAICVSFLEDNEVRLFTEKGREKTWEFDEVFGLQSTQEEVYAEVSPLVQSVLDGYNVCIFAYGQTGSGKTFTMNGPSDNRGVNTRALEDLFIKSAERSQEWRDEIEVSILEVYNEMIRDLLVSGGADDKLEVRQGEFGNYVPGLTRVPVTGLSEVQQLLLTADRNRSQAATDMNEHSSRSHMMMQVTIVGENIVSNQTFRGKLNLVDLAGSERPAKSGATGQALKEAMNINKSLSSLGDVIAARAQKASHIPFRNSTLTYLLQDSLSQDSKTLMFVCISPVIYNAEESKCSLDFASRVRTVELGKATKNVGAKGDSAAGKSATPKISSRPSFGSR